MEKYNWSIKENYFMSTMNNAVGNKRAFLLDGRFWKTKLIEMENFSS